MCRSPPLSLPIILLIHDCCGPCRESLVEWYAIVLVCSSRAIRHKVQDLDLLDEDILEREDLGALLSDLLGDVLSNPKSIY